ncbi:HAD family hydrolase [Paraburkholderia bryophila]|uniref:Phosphoserine phosphatase n=1 Tax=Paraburkholderia bryophila TaxID=420952 RepID=A0A329C817_9BURK|nr:HAD family hydrolase [Paraburkholderia bryophila]RAS30913.1 phosphoserine phosphatase [Paraburkholderia bryophila]
MRSIFSPGVFVTFLALALAACVQPPQTGASTHAPVSSATSVLPSWNDTATKRSLIDFVTRVTTPGSSDFVPPSERIAVFDNDGTLWVEQPAYVQLVFALQRIKALAPQHPEWKTEEPFKSVLAGDMKSVAATGETGAAKILAATHAGMSTEAFRATVHDWMATAKDPRFRRPYTELVYQPMLELMAYLRTNGFKTYIVSGGGVEFIREYAERVYGVPPEQVIGSTAKYKYSVVDGKPVLVRLAQIDDVDDGPGKPASIEHIIGRRPIAAFGNSDGDLQMLEWTTAGNGPRLGALIHHTDASREYSYDRASKMGKLDKALDEAPGKGWVVVDMKEDWNTVFPDPAR